MEQQKPNGALLINSAILGIDVKTIIVHDMPYVIHPPTIAKIAGAGAYLSTLDDVFVGDKIPLAKIGDLNAAAHALSYMINADDSLYDELKLGKLDEIVIGLSVAYSMISPENFTMLSALVKSIGRLTAKPKP